ncbi:MAG: hypothetical protein LBF97_04510 [Elusimicrobiota bacterium]|jgi:hypothetical protein|nr:hypothetical protein [Elusimicrobiota bacterium]
MRIEVRTETTKQQVKNANVKTVTTYKTRYISVRDIIGFASAGIAIGKALMAKKDNINLKKLCGALIAPLFALCSSLEIVQKVLKVAAIVSPIAQIAARASGVWASPGNIGDIVQIVLKTVSKVLISLALMALGALINYILNLEIKVDEVSDSVSYAIGDSLNNAGTKIAAAINNSLNNLANSNISDLVFVDTGNATEQLINTGIGGNTNGLSDGDTREDTEDLTPEVGTIITGNGNDGKTHSFETIVDTGGSRLIAGSNINEGLWYSDNAGTTWNHAYFDEFEGISHVLSVGNFKSFAFLNNYWYVGNNNNSLKETVINYNQIDIETDLQSAVISMKDFNPSSLADNTCILSTITYSDNHNMLTGSIGDFEIIYNDNKIYKRTLVNDLLNQRENGYNVPIYLNSSQINNNLLNKQIEIDKTQTSNSATTIISFANGRNITFSQNSIKCSWVVYDIYHGEYDNNGNLTQQWNGAGNDNNIIQFPTDYIISSISIQKDIKYIDEVNTIWQVKYWAPNTNYSQNDIVYHNEIYYKAKIYFTSGNEFGSTIHDEENNIDISIWDTTFIQPTEEQLLVEEYNTWYDTAIIGYNIIKEEKWQIKILNEWKIIRFWEKEADYFDGEVVYYNNGVYMPITSFKTTEVFNNDDWNFIGDWNIIKWGCIQNDILYELLYNNGWIQQEIEIDKNMFHRVTQIDIPFSQRMGITFTFTNFDGIGIWCSSNNGTSWFKTNIIDKSWECLKTISGNDGTQDISRVIAVNQSNSGIWYCNGDTNFYVSNIEIGSFHLLHDEVEEPDDCVAQGTMAYVTSDVGLNWRILHTHYFLCIITVHGRLVAGSGDDTGLWYSNDNGLNWTQSDKRTGNWAALTFFNNLVDAGSADDEGILYSPDIGEMYHKTNVEVSPYTSFAQTNDKVFSGSTVGSKESSDGKYWAIHSSSGSSYVSNVFGSLLDKVINSRKFLIVIDLKSRLFTPQEIDKKVILVINYIISPYLFDKCFSMNENLYNVIGGRVTFKSSNKSDFVLGTSESDIYMIDKFTSIIDWKNDCNMQPIGAMSLQDILGSEDIPDFALYDFNQIQNTQTLQALIEQIKVYLQRRKEEFFSNTNAEIDAIIIDDRPILAETQSQQEISNALSMKQSFGDALKDGAKAMLQNFGQAFFMFDESLIKRLLIATMHELIQNIAQQLKGAFIQANHKLIHTQQDYVIDMHIYPISMNFSKALNIAANKYFQSMSRNIRVLNQSSDKDIIKLASDKFKFEERGLWAQKTYDILLNTYRVPDNLLHNPITTNDIILMINNSYTKLMSNFNISLMQEPLFSGLSGIEELNLLETDVDKNKFFKYMTDIVNQYKLRSKQLVHVIWMSIPNEHKKEQAQIIFGKSLTEKDIYRGIDEFMNIIIREFNNRKDSI